MVRQIQMSLRPLRRQHNHPDDTTRATIPLDRFPQSPLCELDALLLRHAFLPIRVTEAVDIRRA